MSFREPMLSMLRAGTTAFINVAPVELVIESWTRVEDDSGGRKRVKVADRDPQTFTMIEPRDSGYRDRETIPEGTYTKFDFLLLGEHDAVIGQDDEFFHDGKRFRVENVMIKNGYEIRAKIVRAGEST